MERERERKIKREKEKGFRAILYGASFIAVLYGAQKLKMAIKLLSAI